MNESIFLTVKKFIGFEEDYNAFDSDLLIFINSALSILAQLGVGPANGFKITGASEQWSDFIDESANLEFVKEYIGLKAKKIFDPPASSAVMQAIEERIKELEWRINVEVDGGYCQCQTI